MKCYATIDPGANRQQVEDNLIEFWRGKGWDEDVVELTGEIEVDLVGNDALDVDVLTKSLNILQSNTMLVLTKDLDVGESNLPEDKSCLFDVFLELISVQLELDVKVFFVYTRYYDMGLNHNLAKKIKKSGDMEFMDLFPSFNCMLMKDPFGLRLQIGQSGTDLRFWPSTADLKEFGDLVEESIRISQYWEGATLRRKDAKGGASTVVAKTFEGIPNIDILEAIMCEAEVAVFNGHKAYGERLVLASDSREGSADYLAKRSEVINRRCRESAIAADRMMFSVGPMRIHELREMKDKVIGTVFERLEMPLMLSSWKGAKFFANRVFEGGRFLIRMRLTGREDVCRTLLKEMEEELGVKITLES